MSQQTQINGNRYSFTSLSLSSGNIVAAGQIISQGGEIAKGVIRSINYDATQDPGIVQGNQVVITGRTSGYGVSTGSMEILVAEADDFFAQITNNGQFPIMGVEFDLSVAYSINDIDVRIDDLRGIRITKIGSANQQGNDATTKTLELNIARLELNGIDAFADPST